MENLHRVDLIVLIEIVVRVISSWLDGEKVILGLKVRFLEVSHLIYIRKGFCM